MDLYGDGNDQMTSEMGSAFEASRFCSHLRLTPLPYSNSSWKNWSIVRSKTAAMGAQKKLYCIILNSDTLQGTLKLIHLEGWNFIKDCTANLLNIEGLEVRRI